MVAPNRRARVQVSIVTVLLLFAGAQTTRAQTASEERARAKKDLLECQAANKDAKGRVYLDAYLACRAQRDKAVAEAARAQRVEEHRQALQDALASPDRRTREGAECEVANTSADNHLDAAGLSKCVTEHDTGRRADEAEAARLHAIESAKLAELASVKRAADDAARKEKSDAYAAERHAIDAAARAHVEAEEKKERDAERIAEAKAQRALEQLKAKCGGDYMRIAVGMSWTRVVECSGPFRSTGEVATAMGTVAQFRNSRALISVMNGNVIQWLALR